jgi:hypothetical protein
LGLSPPSSSSAKAKGDLDASIATAASTGVEPPAVAAAGNEEGHEGAKATVAVVTQ